jgi:hypothetical protein
MIDTQRLSQTLERQLAGSPYFVVTAEVRPSGKAVVEIDNDSHDPSRPGGITLSELTEINRGRASLRPVDDVELEVGSPGLTARSGSCASTTSVGRQVQVKLSDGGLVEGMLSGGRQGHQPAGTAPFHREGPTAELDKDPTACFRRVGETRTVITFKHLRAMSTVNLIESFGEFKDIENIDRVTMMAS